MFEVIYSKYNQELIKDAEARLEEEKDIFVSENYNYKIMMIPTGVVLDKNGNTQVILHPNKRLIKE